MVWYHRRSAEPQILHFDAGFLFYYGFFRIRTVNLHSSHHFLTIPQFWFFSSWILQKKIHFLQLFLLVFHTLHMEFTRIKCVFFARNVNSNPLKKHCKNILHFMHFGAKMHTKNLIPLIGGDILG